MNIIIRESPYPGKIGELHRKIRLEFGFGAATVDRVFYDIIGTNFDEEECPNCGASMAEYTVNLDRFDALLLIAIGKAVRRSIKKGVPFKEANKVHVQTLGDADYTTKSKTTQCSKLGLIAKVKGEGGKQVPGMWLITSRGFSALRGDPVPKKVVVFRGKIQERTEETTTIAEVVENYKPGEWVEIAGYAEGKIFKSLNCSPGHQCVDPHTRLPTQCQKVEQNKNQLPIPK